MRYSELLNLIETADETNKREIKLNQLHYYFKSNDNLQCYVITCIVFISD